MLPAQLLFVTGKGGVGKTTVAAALAVHLAAQRRRVLLVETAADRSLAALFGEAELGVEPAVLDGTLSGVRIGEGAGRGRTSGDSCACPFPPPLRQSDLQAVTAAAPGVIEFVVLEHLPGGPSPDG